MVAFNIMLLHDVKRKKMCASQVLWLCCCLKLSICWFSLAALILCLVADFYQQPLWWMLLILCPVPQMTARKTHSCEILLRENTSRGCTSPRGQQWSAALSAGCPQPPPEVGHRLQAGSRAGIIPARCPSPSPSAVGRNILNPTCLEMSFSWAA